MLIRSQDKEMIINMAATNHIYVREVYRPSGSLIDISSDEMRLGYYSTKEKAIKVMDMIQEAYCDFMAVRNGDMWCGKDSVFQMPEDSEVEV
ncbi:MULTISPECIES: hypothetical protein [unclassified Blautia]|uniref:hypothetical protein n=1 Tax=unclassified Blautia TaxID=2648079 RepID=UPI001FD2D135|nr:MULTISPECIES: hypothetical protein [unclassified Blautia]MCJ7861200.1 hypothetical protein [Blautia sp. NSJ-157]MCJ7863996.1 hypothetical protein [Blautia sp. NSJ-140]